MHMEEFENNLNALGLVIDDSGVISSKDTGKVVVQINNSNHLQINTDTIGFAGMVKAKQKMLVLLIFEYITEH